MTTHQNAVPRPVGAEFGSHGHKHVAAVEHGRAGRRDRRRRRRRVRRDPELRRPRAIPREHASVRDSSTPAALKDHAQFFNNRRALRRQPRTRAPFEAFAAPTAPSVRTKYTADASGARSGGEASTKLVPFETDAVHPSAPRAASTHTRLRVAKDGSKKRVVRQIRGRRVDRSRRRLSRAASHLPSGAPKTIQPAGPVGDCANTPAAQTTAQTKTRSPCIGRERAATE